MRGNVHRILFFILVILVFGMISPEFADRSQGTITVTATVPTSGGQCYLDSIALTFPALNTVTPSDVTAQSAVTIHCTKKPITFGISLGQGSDYANGSNRMHNAALTSHIPYTLTGATFTGDAKTNPGNRLHRRLYISERL